MSSNPNPNFNFKLRAGTTIAGRYELGGLIGRGGMGEVWAAKHLALEAKHAIKFMEPSLLSEHDADTILDRFEEEARATSAISRLSRHVVSVSDYGKHEGIPYLVMEHLEGESLEAHMVRAKTLAPERVLEILEQICLGVTQAHKVNLIHRDLKPGNVFICKDERGGLLVKVLDFGLVRSTTEGDKRLTRRGIAVGTPNYMSPEQARAHPSMDAQCDLWSMAVLAYEMLTGKSPWVGDTMQDVLVAVCRSEFSNVSAVKPELGTRFDAFFERAFQRKAVNRFPSGEALVDAFREAARSKEPAPSVQIPVLAHVDPVVTRSTPPESTDSSINSSDSVALAVPKKKKPLIALGALLVLVLLTASVLTVHFRNTSTEGGVRSGALQAPPELGSGARRDSVPPPSPVVASAGPAQAPSATAMPMRSVPPAQSGGALPRPSSMASPGAVPAPPEKPMPVTAPAPEVTHAPPSAPPATPKPIDQSQIL